MHRLTLVGLMSLSLLAAPGCEQTAGSLDTDLGAPEVNDDFSPGAFVWTPDLGIETGNLDPDQDSYILLPETVAVYAGEALSLELELIEPDVFRLRAGSMPEEATFTELPAGALVEWEPTLDDVGRHDFVLLVVDADEPNLVISQEMMSVDVLPRFKFIEYGF